MADERGAADVISFRDPAGNRVEAFHGGRIADESFRPTRHNRGLPYRDARRGTMHHLKMKFISPYMWFCFNGSLTVTNA